MSAGRPRGASGGSCSCLLLLAACTKGAPSLTRRPFHDATQLVGAHAVLRGVCGLGEPTQAKRFRMDGDTIAARDAARRRCFFLGGSRQEPGAGVVGRTRLLRLHDGGTVRLCYANSPHPASRNWAGTAVSGVNQAIAAVRHHRRII